MRKVKDIGNGVQVNRCFIRIGIAENLTVKILMRTMLCFTINIVMVLGMTVILMETQ